MTSLFIPNQESSVSLTGKAGLIEARSLSPIETKTDTIVILCHPHPLFGGSMNNKVITTIARSFRDMGYRSLRFNFRGVGKSEGEFDRGVGETNDLLAIIQQVHQSEGDVPIFLAGFSFGSYVAYRGAQLTSVNGLITIAPAVDRYEFAAPYPTCPWLLCIPERDEVVPPTAMIQWAEQLTVPVHVVRFPESSHFFHGTLVELKQTLIDEFSLS